MANIVKPPGKQLEELGLNTLAFEQPDEQTRTQITEPNDLERSIGRVIRRYRSSQELTIVQLAELSGVSKGMISKIETGQISASLSTLKTMSETLKIPLSTLFKGYDEKAESSLIRNGAGYLVQGRGTKFGHLYQQLGQIFAPNIKFEPHLIELNAASQLTQTFQHPGVEFIYMLEGEMEYTHAGDSYNITPGDSFLFDGRLPHGPTKLITTPCRFLSLSSQILSLHE